MATSVSLKMYFLDSNGTEITRTVKYVDPDITYARGNTFAQAMITNTDLFSFQLASVEKIEKIVTTTTELTA